MSISSVREALCTTASNLLLRDRMSLRGYTLRELVEITRQRARGLGLRTDLPLGFILRNHIPKIPSSSNIEQF